MPAGPSRDISEVWTRRPGSFITFNAQQRDMYRAMMDAQIGRYRSTTERQGYSPFSDDSTSGLDEWELPSGDIVKIVDLTTKDLKLALKLLHKKMEVAGQESKVISLEKEWAKRGHK